MKAEIADRIERQRELSDATEAIHRQPGQAIGLEFAEGRYTRYQPVTAAQIEARLVDVLTQRKNKTADGIGIDVTEAGRDVVRITWRNSLANGESGMLTKLSKRYTPEANVQALIIATIEALQRIRTHKKPAASEEQRHATAAAG